MNALFLIGIVIFFGALGGKILQRYKVPQVVGYITVGVILGGSVLGVLKLQGLEVFTPLIHFTLGIIGFLIGAELKGGVFKKYGRSIYLILFNEGMLAFLLVFTAVTLITGKAYLGLLFGAIASATDPASTVNVLWEYKARGPLTTTLTSIVALDDGLALILYGLVSVFSKAMISNESYSLWNSISYPIIELIKCLVIGAVGGVILTKLISRFKEDLALSITLGGVAAIVGLSVYMQLDLILVAMTMGAVIVNVIPKVSERLFKKIKELTVPLYIFFFVFVGASLDVHVFLQLSVAAIVIAYLIARSAGKIFGAVLGAYMSKAKKAVVKYCGICLFTQGGVAIGLAMSIAHNLSGLGKEGSAAGVVIVSVVAATTFVVQLIGPFFVKLGITKADEVWRNVTREDVVENLKVSDVMRKDFSLIRESATLDKVMDVVKETESYHFPVVNSRNELSGLVSLGGLRSAFMERELNQIVLAKDVAGPVGCVLYQGHPLREAFDIFDKREIDFLPVLKDENSKEIIGIVEYHQLVETVNRKTLERQEILDKEQS